MMTGQIINELAQILWRQSWQLAVLVALVMPISMMSQKRYPRFTYILWLMVAIKSIIPFQWVISANSSSDLVGIVQSALVLPAMEIGARQLGGFDLVQTATLLWIGVALFLGIRLILNEIRFRNLIRVDPLQRSDEFSTLINYYDLKQIPNIASSPSATSPMTIGFRDPLILLPEHMKEHKAEELMPVIAHEMAHIKRQDIWSISLQVVISILYFFHPLMRIVNQQLDLNRERICDDMAVNALNLSYREYGRELLSHMESMLKPQSPVAITGGMFLSKKNILKRFEYLMNIKGGIMLKIKNSQKLIIGVLFGVLILLSCTENTLDDQDNSFEPPLAKDNVVFVAYDSPPEPIGGYTAIQNAVIYPEKARAAGTEGTVIVQATLGKNGETIDVIVLKGVEDESLNQAAVNAMSGLKWKPASKEGNPVSVRIAVPIVFRLKTD